VTTTPTDRDLDERIESLTAVIREVRRERLAAEEGTYHRFIAVDLHTYERLLRRMQDARPVQPIIQIDPDPPIMRVMGEVVVPAVGFGILVMDATQIAPLAAGIRQGAESARQLEVQRQVEEARAGLTRPTSTGKRSVDL